MGEIELPKGGAYVNAGQARYHITIEGECVKVRLVEIEGRGTPNLLLHMPAGNLVEIFPSDR